jgi:isopenicillin-N N-acyltransferase-like protein
MPVLAREPIPTVLVEGEARERGRQHGELAADRVGHSVELYMRRFEHFAGLKARDARRRAESYTEAIAAYDPEILEEIYGIAEGAGCQASDVMAVNCRSELMFGTNAPLECTSFGLQPEITATGRTYVGQNWDWAPEVKASLILLVVKQAPRPTAVLLDEAGMVGRMGMNSAGIALATNTLIAEDSGPGVPYNVLLRGVLNSRSLAEAIGALVRPQRALGANFLLGDGKGQVLDIEASASTVDYIPPANGVVTHGNHFAGTRHRGRDRSLERFPDSLYRECRIRAHFDGLDAPVTEDDMKEALRDSFGRPNAICRSVDPDQEELERIETIASIIMDATEQRLLLAVGPPDRNPYAEHTVAELANGALLTAV